MIMNYLKQIKQLFLLDLFFSFLIIALCFTVFGDPMLFIIMSGFIISFFIKESSPARYAKLIFLNSLFFGFLFTLVYKIGEFVISNGQSSSDGFVFFIYFSILFGTVPNLFGGLICIILKGIAERLKISKISL